MRVQAESISMTHPEKFWVKESVSQLLQTSDTGQEMKKEDQLGQASKTELDLHWRRCVIWYLTGEKHTFLHFLLFTMIEREGVH